MVDVHFVDNCHVKIVEDQALRDMPGKVRVPFDIRNLSRPPTFIRRLIMLAAANGEGRDDVGVEGGCVIVIDKYDDVWPFGFLPCTRPFVSFENRTKIFVAGLALIDRDAKQWNMAGAYTS